MIRADARAPARPDQSAQPERLVGAQPGKLGKMRPQELALRFAFGASISVVAGLVSLAWGPRAGGMFLAFPAILPATLTLIEKKEGTDEARHDVAGAFLGAFGLVAFGAVTVWALHRMAVGVALAAAAASWAVVASGLYLLTEWARRWLSGGEGGGARRPAPD